ncbi:MAG: tetratricopeptide repeat protein [Thermodesulfobacteriota bacterium]
MKNVAFAYSQALAGYKARAARGDSSSMRNLGLMYLNGQGVPRNPREALRWFVKAADAGDSDSMLILGEMHVNGVGTPRNPDAARGFFARAAAAGREEARSWMEKLERK